MKDNKIKLNRIKNKKLQREQRQKRLEKQLKLNILRRKKGIKI